MKLAPPDVAADLSEPEHADLSSSSHDSDSDDHRTKRAAVESFFFARSHNNKAGLILQIQRLGNKHDPKGRPQPMFNVQRKKHRLLKPMHGILRSVEGAAGIVGANSSRRHSDQFYCTRHSATALSRNNSGRCRMVEGATLPVPKQGFNQISFDGIEMENSPPSSPYLGGANMSSTSLAGAAETLTATCDEEEDRGVYHVYTVDEHPQSACRITKNDIRFNVSASEADQAYLKEPSQVSPTTSASRRHTLPPRVTAPRDSLQAYLATPITWHLQQVGARTYRLVDSSTDMAIGYWTGERGWRFVSKGETLMSLSEKVRVYDPMFRKPVYLDQVVHRLRSKSWAEKAENEEPRRRRSLINRHRSNTETLPTQHNSYRVTLVDAILFSAIQLLMQQQLKQAAAESMVMQAPSMYALPQSDSQLSFKNVRRSLSLSRPKLDSRQSLQLDTRPSTEQRKSVSEHRRSWTDPRRKSFTPSPPPPTKRILSDIQDSDVQTSTPLKPKPVKKHTRFDSQPQAIPQMSSPVVRAPAYSAISTEPLPAVQAVKKRNLVARFFQKVKMNMK